MAGHRRAAADEAADLFGPFSTLEERIIAALMRLDVRRRVAVTCAVERRLRVAGTPSDERHRRAGSSADGRPSGETTATG